MSEVRGGPVSLLETVERLENRIAEARLWRSTNENAPTITLSCRTASELCTDIRALGLRNEKLETVIKELVADCPDCDGAGYVEEELFGDTVRNACGSCSPARYIVEKKD